MSMLTIARERLATSVVQAHVSCPHEGMGTYVTRFGDTCCEACHEPLSWDAADVAPGLYGDDTDAWIEAREDALAFDEDYPTWEATHKAGVANYACCDSGSCGGHGRNGQRSLRNAKARRQA